MLLSELRDQSKSLVNLWMFLLGIQVGFVLISSIVMSQIFTHSSGTGIWEYLTLTRGDGIVAWIWLVCNLGMTILDFTYTLRVHRENRKVLKKTHSFEETIILKKMYRNLKYALIFMIVAMFAQIVHGFIWWVVGGTAIIFKIFYVRELIHLYPKLYNFKLPFQRPNQE